MRPFNKILLLITFLMVCSCSIKNQETTSETKQSGIVVMAYYVPERDYHPEEIPVEQLTHIIFSFTNVINGEMKFRNPEDAGPKLKALVEQKKRNPSLNVMIACGGWGADGFSDMASTPEGRDTFVQSAKAFIEEYQLDGLDMDWEYPTIPAAGTGARDEDRENFTALMSQLREALDATGREQTLTFASAGWVRYYKGIETLEVMKYANYMNVMTYDQVSGVSEYTGHHTPLGYIPVSDIEGTPFQADLIARSKRLNERELEENPEPRSTERIVSYLIAEGVNPAQIVIGGAFYGRAWKGVPPTNNGLYQRSGGIKIGWSAYHHIRKTFEKDPNFIRYWDENAKAPFIYNAQDSIFITYDDTVSVAMKAQYAIDKNLGGIMFWELGNDTKEEGSLLDAIHEVARTSD